MLRFNFEALEDKQVLSQVLILQDQGVVSKAPRRKMRGRLCCHTAVHSPESGRLQEASVWAQLLSLPPHEVLTSIEVK